MPELRHSELKNIIAGNAHHLLCVCVCVCGITVTQLIETLIFLRWEHEQETANET